MRQRWSLPLFADIYEQWQAWRAGIPPRAGVVVLEMNPRLLAAFAALDRAKARAESAELDRAKARAKTPAPKE